LSNAARTAFASSLVALALAAAACGLSLDYLSNGPPLPDAGGAIPDTGTAPGDGPDGASPGDAGGGPDADAASPGVCAASPTAFFCADYDEGDITHVYSKGALVSVPAANVSASARASLSSTARSGAGSFQGDLFAADAGADLLARFEEPVAVPSAKYEDLKVAIRLPLFTPSVTIDLVSLHLSSPTSGQPVRAFFSIQQDGKGHLFLDNGSNTADAPFLLPADLATTWHVFDLRVDLVPSLVARVFADGTSTPVAEINSLAGPFTTAGQTTFYLGPSAPGSPNAFQILYDDVVVTAE
jgi:hypothetical protein